MFQIGLLCTNWFLIDFINLISNDSYYFLKPSILETLTKNSLSLVV